MSRIELLFSLGVALSSLLPAAPAQPSPAAPPAARVYTDADYAQAEKFMAYNVNPLVQHVVRSPSWMPDGRMWYRDAGSKGNTIMLIDPVRRHEAPGLRPGQNLRRRSSLSASPARPSTPYHLPVYELVFTDSDRSVQLTAFGKRLTCDLAAKRGLPAAR